MSFYINFMLNQAEVIEMSEDEEIEGERAVPEREEFSRPSYRLAESDSESEGEVDEEELAQRRLRMRNKAMQKIQEEQEVSSNMFTKNKIFIYIHFFSILK